MEAGLPNITGKCGFLGLTSYSTIGGAFTKTETSATGAFTAGDTKSLGVFDASRSNTTYGSSETVTPLSLSTKFFIKY